LEAGLVMFYCRATGKKGGFSLRKYLFLLLLPLLAVFFSALFTGWKLLYIFAAFMALGTLLEWVMGFTCRVILGERIWTYHRFTFSGKHTSALSIVPWGIVGVFAALLFNFFSAL